MTRTDQRQVLEAFSRDYTRELHNFMAADLCAQPQLASIFHEVSLEPRRRPMLVPSPPDARP